MKRNKNMANVDITTNPWQSLWIPVIRFHTFVKVFLGIFTNLCLYQHRVSTEMCPSCMA